MEGCCRGNYGQGLRSVLLCGKEKHFFKEAHHE